MALLPVSVLRHQHHVCSKHQPSSRRAHRAAAATNAATAEASAAEQRRSDTEAVILSKTGRAAPGVADRVLAAGGVLLAFQSPSIHSACCSACECRCKYSRQYCRRGKRCCTGQIAGRAVIIVVCFSELSMKPEP
jgi:hypothetical protein